MAAAGTAQAMKAKKGKGDKVSVPKPIHGHSHGKDQLGHKHGPETPHHHSH